MNKYVFKGYQDFLDMKVPIIEVEGQNRRVMLGLTFEKLVAARGGQINRLIKEEDLTNTAKGIIDVEKLSRRLETKVHFRLQDLYVMYQAVSKLNMILVRVCFQSDI